MIFSSLVGIICCVLSILIFVSNIYMPDETAEFFGTDPLSDYDEYHLCKLINFYRFQSTIELEIY